MKADKGKQAAFLYDLRVRDRFLQSGALEQKTVERYLAELPDLEGHAEALPFEQPALAGRGGQSSDGSAS
jgi:hypothetical protein